MTSEPLSVSSAPVGSSANTSFGRCTSARATAARWRSPPDTCPGRRAASGPMPSRSSAAHARRCASRRMVDHASQPGGPPASTVGTPIAAVNVLRRLGAHDLRRTGGSSGRCASVGAAVGIRGIFGPAERRHPRRISHRWSVGGRHGRASTEFSWSKPVRNRRCTGWTTMQADPTFPSQPSAR